jgi:hypothetical protein
MIATVGRVAQHRNGGGAEPYLSLFCTGVDGTRLHALLFAEPGRVAVFNLDDPTERRCGGQYEHDLRAIAADIGLPFDSVDPLDSLHARAASVLTLVRQRRAEMPPGPDRAKLRAIGRHLDHAVHAMLRAIERAKA